MKELERLIELAKKKLPSQFITIQLHNDGWDLQKQGKQAEDVNCTTFDQVLARLREWAGEPESEPEPMTVPELMALRDRAVVQTGHHITASFGTGGVFLTRGGVGVINNGTLEQVVAKLREWATPPLPEFTTLENVPVAWVQWRAKGCDDNFDISDTRKVDEICRETMTKLQKQ